MSVIWFNCNIFKKKMQSTCKDVMLEGCGYLLGWLCVVYCAAARRFRWMLTGPGQNYHLFRSLGNIWGIVHGCSMSTAKRVIIWIRGLCDLDTWAVWISRGQDDFNARAREEPSRNTSALCVHKEREREKERCGETSEGSRGMLIGALSHVER